MEQHRQATTLTAPCQRLNHTHPRSAACAIYGAQIYNRKAWHYLSGPEKQPTCLAACLGDPPDLEKLDLRWNKLSALPVWVYQLRQRGCTMYH